MARARDIANIINSGTFLTPANASDTYTTIDKNGLVHINTTTTTSASATITVDNIFSSTYDDYYIDLRINPSTDANHDVRLVSNGTARSSNYGNACFGFSGNSTTPLVRGDIASQIVCTPIASQTTNTVKIGFWINTSDTGNYRCFGTTSYVRFGGAEAAATFAARHFGGSGITGIQYVASAGVATGTIKVYGYKK